MGSLHTLSGGLCRFRRFRKGADGSFTAGCGGFTNGFVYSNFLWFVNFQTVCLLQQIGLIVNFRWQKYN